MMRLCPIIILCTSSPCCLFQLTDLSLSVLWQHQSFVTQGWEWLSYGPRWLSRISNYDISWWCSCPLRRVCADRSYSGSVWTNASMKCVWCRLTVCIFLSRATNDLFPSLWIPVGVRYSVNNSGIIISTIHFHFHLLIAILIPRQ